MGALTHEVPTFSGLGPPASPCAGLAARGVARALMMGLHRSCANWVHSTPNTGSRKGLLVHAMNEVLYLTGA